MCYCRVCLFNSVTETEAKDVHRSLKVAAGIFKGLKVCVIGIQPCFILSIYVLSTGTGALTNKHCQDAFLTVLSTRCCSLSHN